MRTRTSIAIALALLLGITLWVWLLFSGHPPPPGESSRPDPAKLPPPRGLCRGNADCPPGWACVGDPLANTLGCIRSECETDNHCSPGYVCRHVLAGGAQVRRCIFAGVRKEGERCRDFPTSPRNACEPGLLCNWFFCGRPCSHDGTSSCPRGSTCYDGWAGASCVPTCGPHDCPPGQQCIRIKDAFSACGILVGEDCDAVPCPPGQQCIKRIGATKHIGMSCVTKCAQDGSCPEGFFCERRTCRRKCRPDANNCAPYEECIRPIADEEGLYRCDLKLW